MAYASLLLTLLGEALLSADPTVLPLFAQEAWYRDCTEPEVTLVGTVERSAVSGRLGAPARFQPFLVQFTGPDGKPASRGLYLPGKAFSFVTLVGRKVRLVGKLREVAEAGEIYREFWPALCEELDPARPLLVDQAGILARSRWQPEGARQVGMTKLVVKQPTELAPLLKLRGEPTRVQALAEGMLAQHFQLTKIDWNEQMLVVVSAGLQTKIERVEITRALTTEKNLTIYYRLVAGPGLGIGCPGEAVLVKRYSGAVVFQQEKEP